MDDVETVTMRLQDQFTGPASAIGDSAGMVESSVRAMGNSLTGAQSALGGLTSAENTAAAGARNLADDIASANSAAGKSQGALADAAQGLTSAVTGTGDAAKKTAVPFEALAGATTTLGGSMGGVGAQGINMVKFLGQLGPYATVAIVAVLALAAAFVALYSAIAKSLTASDASRSEFLKLQGAMQGSARDAGKLQNAISAVSASSALGRDKIVDYATSLDDAGLSGGELQRALEAASIAGSAGGEKVASAFLADVKAAKAAGASVDALSTKMKTQLGGVAARQAMSLTVQMTKLGESVTELFAGADIEPFLAGLQDSFSLLSQNTVIGQQLRTVLSQAMTEFFAGAAKALPYIKEAFVGVLIVAVQAYIAFKKVSNAIRDIIGPTDDAGASAKGLGAALEVGKLAAYSLLAVFALIAAAVFVAMLPILAFVAILYGLHVLGKMIGEALVSAWNSAAAGASAMLDAVIAVISGIVSTLSAVDLSAIASGMIDGLVAGIEASIGRVVGAVTDLAGAAVKAMETALQMGSPSHIFRDDIAKEGIGGALVVGLDASADDVNASVENLVDPKAIKAEAKGARDGGGGRWVYVEINCTDRDLAEQVRVVLRSELGAEALDASPVT